MRHLIALLIAVFAVAPPVRATDVTIFAAASLGPALSEIAEDWERDTGQTVRLSVAGSSVLARQVISGAPADIFISASTGWADFVAAAQPPLDRSVLATNSLVLIASEAAVETAIADLSTALGEDRLAVALTDHVPAGQYARAALEYFGQWAALSDRLAEADNVRGALSFVALGVAPYGIVYGSDTVGTPNIRVLQTLPADSHPPIRYPALLLHSGAAAEAFFAYLQSPQARARFRAAGFLPP